jgi:hypothetical protein
MAAIIKHVFANPLPDDPAFVGVRPSHWNDALKLTSGVQGALLFRDLTDAVYGSALLTPAAGVPYWSGPGVSPTVLTIGAGLAVVAGALTTTPAAPLAHAATHAPGGSDALAIDAAAAVGSLRTLGTAATQAAAGNDSRLSNARTPTVHATSHEAGGSDPLTALDAGILTAGTLLDARLSANVARRNAANVFAGSLSSTPDATNDLGLSGQRWRDLVVSRDVNAGALINASTAVRVTGFSAPAAGGAIRLPNSGQIYWRNLADTADVGLYVDTGPNLRMTGIPIIAPSVTGATALGVSTFRFSDGWFSGTVTATTLVGALDAAQLTGSVADARLSANVLKFTGGYPGGTANFLRSDGTFAVPAGGGGSGDVTGPASSLDTQVARFNGTTGKIIKASNVTIDDSGIVVAAGLGGTPLNATMLTSGALPDARLSANVLKVTGGFPGGTANFLREDGSFAAPAGGGGSGDVTGPASAVVNNVAAFNATTGKAIKDSGINYGNLARRDTANTYPIGLEQCFPGLIRFGPNAGPYIQADYDTGTNVLRFEAKDATQTTLGFPFTITRTGVIVRAIPAAGGGACLIRIGNDLTAAAAEVRVLHSTVAATGYNAPERLIIENVRNGGGIAYVAAASAAHHFYTEGGSSYALRLTGTTTYAQGDIHLNGNLMAVGGGTFIRSTWYYEMFGQPTNPPTAANTLKLHAKDNGSGKLQLLVQFPTGAPVVVATEV